MPAQHILKVYTFCCIILSFFNCQKKVTNWPEIKENAYVECHLPNEFNTPRILSNNTLGWEDGLYVSRDGLHLYATYMPADFLSFVLNGDKVENLVKYDRGPHYDMDLKSNPVGTFLWYHSDIIFATRSSITEEFGAWTTSNMKRSIYSEGGFGAFFADSSTISICVFTSNDVYTANTNIKCIRNTTPNPSGIGDLLTPIDSFGTQFINTAYIEDNPHVELIDDTTLVLFFDSEDRPGGEGGHDIWYSVSTDNGVNWSKPLPVTTVNTYQKEHQPHLFFDGTDWWLYYSAEHSDGKLAIFRRKQQTTGNWDDWGTAELVLSAGNTAGIGEPSLTSHGDLYFVVVYDNPEGTKYDRFDADAWVATRK
ncbi:MAG: sialidase family protein [candidate division WOR-3 bacterium]